MVGLGKSDVFCQVEVDWVKHDVFVKSDPMTFAKMLTYSHSYSVQYIMMMIAMMMMIWTNGQQTCPLYINKHRR